MVNKLIVVALVMVVVATAAADDYYEQGTKSYNKRTYYKKDEVCPTLDDPILTRTVSKKAQCGMYASGRNFRFGRFVREPVAAYLVVEDGDEFTCTMYNERCNA